MKGLAGVVCRASNDVMADVVFLLLALGFFSLCAGYVKLCDRIVGADPDGGPTPVPHLGSTDEGVRI